MADSVRNKIRYFQNGPDDEKKETPPFMEKRTRTRSLHNHSPEHQALLEDIREVVKNTHSCKMPKQIQDNAIGIVNAVEEIGGDSFKNGIQVSRDVIKTGRDRSKTKKRISGKVLEYVAVGVIAIIGTLIVTGFWEKVIGVVK